MSTSSYHRGDLPEATLRAARALLDTMPAEDISVRELARAAGVSHAAPYRHFGDREGFILALTTRCLEEFVDDQRAAFAGAPDGSRLLAVGSAYVAFARTHPYVFHLVYAVRSRSDDRLEAAAGEHGAVLVQAVDDAVRAGQLPDGIDRRDVEAALWSLAHGLAELTGSGFLPAERTSAILGALLGG